MTANTTLTLNTTDMDSAMGHIRGALERSGFEDLYLTRTADGFQVRGARGSRWLATIASVFPPLLLTGFFSRSGVVARCRRSLTDGDGRLRVNLRIGALMESDDQDEVNFVTRGLGEMLGDHQQKRRVLDLLVSQIEPEVSTPAPAPNLTREDRRAAFQDRLRRGRRRRALQVSLLLAAIAFVVALPYLPNLVR